MRIKIIIPPQPPNLDGSYGIYIWSFNHVGYTETTYDKALNKV